MVQSPLLQQLLDSLRCLPGVGPKSAQRMALHLLERDREGARQLALALQVALDRIGHCRLCRNLSETDLCVLCNSAQGEGARRDRSILCIVESPADVLAVGQTADYQGLFFVLMGHLSPLDGIGPDDLGLDLLEQRLAQREVQEVILATNPTVEGEATAHYIGEMARQYGVKATRIAHGVPLGGELEYVDSGTLSHALSGRREMP